MGIFFFQEKLNISYREIFFGIVEIFWHFVPQICQYCIKISLFMFNFLHFCWRYFRWKCYLFFYMRHHLTQKSSHKKKEEKQRFGNCFLSNINWQTKQSEKINTKAFVFAIYNGIFVGAEAKVILTVPPEMCNTGATFAENDMAVFVCA